MQGEITFGEFTLSSVVAVLLGVVFEAAPTFPSQYKKLIALVFGIVLGLLGIVVQEGIWTAANIVLHTVAGIMYGVAAIGTYHTINKTAETEKRPPACRAYGPEGGNGEPEKKGESEESDRINRIDGIVKVKSEEKTGLTG